MADPAQKPQTNSSTLQRALDKRLELYSFIGKAYGETIMYIGRNPGKAFWLGAAVASMTFGAGFKAGRSASSDNRIENTYSVVKLVHGQNITMSGRIEDILKKQDTLVQSIQEIKNSQVELRNDFNNMRIQKTVEQGQARAEQVPKPRKHWWQVWK